MSRKKYTDAKCRKAEGMGPENSAERSEYKIYFV